MYRYAAEEQVRSYVAGGQAEVNLDTDVGSAKENETVDAAGEVADKTDTTDYKDLDGVDTKNVETTAALDAVDTVDAHFATWEEAAG